MANTEAAASAAEAALRKQVRILAMLAGISASAAVTIPQFMPQRMERFPTGVDPMAVFLGLCFLTFVIGVATPIYAYARAVRIGARMPAAAFAPLALLLAAIIGMIVIGTIRKQTRDVEFIPKARPPLGTQPVK